MRDRVLILLAIFAILLFSLSVQAEPAQTPIKFGATLTLSSATGPFALACAHGIELAVEDVNAAGGIQNHPLEMRIQDFRESSLNEAASAAQELINIEKVVALFPNWSEDAEVIAPIADKAGIVSMTLGAGGPYASRFAPSAFRATTSDSELAQAAVRDEIAHGSKRACLVVANTGYYVDISEVILSTWRSLGGEVAYHESLEHGAGDANAVVTRLRASRCDSIFIWAAPGTIGPIVSGLRQQKVKARRVMPWFADTKEVLDRIQGDSQPYTLHRWIFENKEFADRYLARFKEPMIRPAGNCYDGIRVMAHVMNQVGTDGAKVRDALLHLSDYKGVTGPFIITKDRERTGESFKAFSILNGQVIEAKNP